MAAVHIDKVERFDFPLNQIMERDDRFRCDFSYARAVGFRVFVEPCFRQVQRGIGAGAAAGAFVPWINGSYTNIVGLCLYEAAKLLDAASP